MYQIATYHIAISENFIPSALQAQCKAGGPQHPFSWCSGPPDSCFRPKSLGQTGFAQGLEAAFEVLDDVVDVLQSDGQADGALVDALVLELLQRLLGVRGGGRVDDQRLHVGHVRQQRTGAGCR